MNQSGFAGSIAPIRAALATTETWSSGTRCAAHTAPTSFLPGPTISSSQTSLGSAMVSASPASHQPCCLQEFPGDADRLAGGGRAREQEPREHIAVDQALGADEFRAALERRFADGHLPLVHRRIGRSQIAERLRHLRNAARQRPAVTGQRAAIVVAPFAQLHFGAGRVFRSAAPR